MVEELKNALRVNIAPIIFLVIAGALCFVLEPDVRKDPILLIIGAALTRVKRTE